MTVNYAFSRYDGPDRLDALGSDAVWLLHGTENTLSKVKLYSQDIPD